MYTYLSFMQRRHSEQCTSAKLAITPPFRYWNTQTYIFPTSALDVEGSGQHPPNPPVPNVQETGWAPELSVEKIKISFPCQELNSMNPKL
jgi:hypothetical protein